VRRYEDNAVRRMSRVCDDLVKLRRSGTLDEAADSRPAAVNRLEEACSNSGHAARQPEPAAEFACSRPPSGEIEHEAEPARELREVERPDFNQPAEHVDDWGEIITITYNPAEDCRLWDTNIAEPDAGEPLQTEGPHDNRNNDRADRVGT